MARSDLLTQEQGQDLVRLARYALETRIGRKMKAGPPVDPRLYQTGATFVTLTVDGALRGCIGTPEARGRLVDDVQENAVRAATMDPRFPPVSPAELGRIHIEVSVLTPPRLLDCSPEERLDRVKPGVGKDTRGRGISVCSMPQSRASARCLAPAGHRPVYFSGAGISRTGRRLRGDGSGHSKETLRRR
jgi:uncharacterized protein (TIGR00296 family)